MKINGTTLIELTQDDVVDGKLIIPDEVTHIADNVGRFLDSIDIDAIIAPNVLEVGIDTLQSIAVRLGWRVSRDRGYCRVLRLWQTCRNASVRARLTGYL
jgi:hypothetical protein